MNFSNSLRTSSHVALLLIFFLILLLCPLCVTGAEIADVKGTNDFDSTNPLSGDLPWSDITLTDAISGEEFTLSSLMDQGKPVVMHTFTIWCSACSSQLKETTLFQEETNGMYPVFSVDIDPNEKDEDIKSHVRKNNYTGHFAAAPAEFSVGLAQDAGIDVLMQIPQTFIFSGNDAYKLPAGVYPAKALNEIITSVTGEESSS